jgi:NTE family protein
LPLIAVNATDIAYGISFSFTQPYFELLCSDLSNFPVARAVAASNGFPVLFSPITLTSYNERCQTERPPTAAPAQWAETPDELSRRALLARNADHYLDPQRTQYVHLMDGGIADNLALRAAANGLIALDENSDAFPPGRLGDAAAARPQCRRPIRGRSGAAEAACRGRPLADLRRRFRYTERRLQFRNAAVDR